ncbi:MAG TPA: ABC transporter substrate-binding protein [Trebonia sp.]|nr:ABC transporter substrate-binding protein [Trebonia sp.]
MLTNRYDRGKRVAAIVAAGLLVAGIAACSSSKSSTGSGSGSSASAGGNQPALVMESSPENSITRDFNPFSTTAPIYGMGADGLIYEPLIQFNLAKPPQDYPYLATGYKWGADGKSITFTIRTGVKWSDGKPMTPADVVFTYTLLKANPKINLNGLPITSVSAAGNDVTINFSSAQYTNLQNIAGVAILPQHIWSSVGDPSTFADPTPVGTGPYVIGNFTPEGFTLTANPSYWQAVPVKKVYFPAYASNTGAQNALFSDKIDWTGNFIPGLQQSYVNPDPTHHGFWMAPNASNALFPNLNTWPTNQLAVRKAISAAIDRTAIGNQGEAGLEAPATSSTGLTLPTFSAWTSDTVTSNPVKAAADVASAGSILTAAGYKLDSAGFYALNGREVKLTVVDPASYTDYAQDDQIIAQNLKAAHINATFSGLTVDAWNAAIADGNFQLSMHWGNGGISPYNMYDNWLDDTLATGNNATGDYERLKDPAVQADLTKLASDSTVADQTKDLVPLETYIAANLPVIPTVNAAAWFEYNSKHFTGWPTQDNPYESGQPSGSNNGGSTGTDEVVILHLKPVS